MYVLTYNFNDLSYFRDKKKMTALHLVAISGVVEIAKLLIEHGAHVNPNREDDTMSVSMYNYTVITYSSLILMAYVCTPNP